MALQWSVKATILNRLTMRKTREQHIEDFKKVHGNTYDYSETEISRENSKRWFVSVRCKIHGVFSINRDDHKRGIGCNACGNIKKGQTKKNQAKIEFFEKMKTIHPTYDFSLFDYKGSTEYSTVICSVHGKIQMQPVTLLGGHRCMDCSRISSGEIRAKDATKALEDLIRVHGDRYDYSEFEYERSTKKIKVVCRQHGKFEINYDNHRQGRGCQKCAKNGYQPNKPGSIYILICNNVTKVGITNRKVLSRVKGINKSSGLNFKIHSYHYFEDGSIPRNIETNLLEYLKNRYRRVKQYFNGSTECFLDVDITDLENQLYQLLGEHNEF